MKGKNYFVLISGLVFFLILANPLHACVGRLLVVAVGDSIDQVIMGFETRIQKKKLAETFKKAKSQKDLESLNQILKLKRERENRIL